MSKKNKKSSAPAVSASSVTEIHGEEYRVIKHDLFKVLYLNVIYLALVLAVYFTDSKTHYLENWFSKVFHF